MRPTLYISGLPSSSPHPRAFYLGMFPASLSWLLLTPPSSVLDRRSQFQKNPRVYLKSISYVKISPTLTTLAQVKLHAYPADTHSHSRGNLEKSSSPRNVQAHSPPDSSWRTPDLGDCPSQYLLILPCIAITGLPCKGYPSPSIAEGDPLRRGHLHHPGAQALRYPEKLTAIYDNQILKPSTPTAELIRLGILLWYNASSRKVAQYRNRSQFIVGHLIGSFSLAFLAPKY
ncbi:hypothetical protein BS47DRAFT_1395711 [Hydnum rufescens UP504]|uniref:Uncharacterized protein n=1 Tax=Hydnum rufescens UP504 TaxID=1448309 RepID=A0A9P6ART3_9AGAM|nr:hypothetical protein BS47DRAFT_1395711 [Hydnum rufescens UP504]